MWNQDQNNNNFRKFLVGAEIAIIAVAALALANYVWLNTGIGYLDNSLQVAIVCVFALVILLTANYVMDRRW